MKAFLHYINYASKYRRHWLLLIFLLFFGSILPLFIIKPIDYNYIALYLAILGVVVAIWILIVNLREEWIRDLPKKLTVHLISNTTEGNEYLFSIYNAPLLSREDIRAWSQQLGGNISESGPTLNLKYFELIKTAKIEYFKGMFYEHFEVNYYIVKDEVKHKGYKVREYVYGVSSKNNNMGYHEMRIDNKRFFTPLNLAEIKLEIEKMAEKA